MQIAYFVHGRGRGHASRTLSIVESLLADGHDVRTFGGGDADDLLSGLDGYQSVVPIRPGLRSTLAVPRRLSTDWQQLRRLSPDLVVSDGDGPSLVAARSLGLRTVSIGHDLVFTRCRLPRGLPRWALNIERRSAFLATRMAKHGVAVHFLPIKPTESDTICARPALRPDLRRDLTNDGHVVCYFRDRNGQQAIRWALDAGLRTVVFGDQSLDVDGAENHAFEPAEFAQALCSCLGVICSAGSNLLAETVLLKKPVLALYMKRDSEQCLNAIMLERAKVGASCAFEDLDQETVTSFVERARAGDFANLDLGSALPDTVTAARQVVADLSSRAA